MLDTRPSVASRPIPSERRSLAADIADTLAGQYGRTRRVIATVSASVALVSVGGIAEICLNALA